MALTSTRRSCQSGSEKTHGTGLGAWRRRTERSLKIPPLFSNAPCPIARAVVLLLIAASAAAAPLPTHDQSPLLAGFGLPRPMSTRFDSSDWQLHADFNWGSSALIQNNAREQLIVDGETRDLRLSAQGKLTDRILLALSVPYRSTSGGSLDSFINSWHDFFGLPTGERQRLPKDELRVSYVRDGVPLINRRSNSSGLGDASIAAGWQLIHSPETALTGWMELKLPTGSSDDLTGSEAVDVSAIVAGEHRFNDRWSVFGQTGITHLGKGDLLPSQQRSWIGTAMAGVSSRLWKRVELTIQLDGHTAAFDDSQLDYLGEAIILDVGGAIDIGDHWILSLGVSEDVMVEASPDVVFIVGVSRTM
jgi:hypothetical protein